MSVQEDVTAQLERLERGEQIVVSGPEAFDALLAAHLAKRTANIDFAAEQAWLRKLANPKPRRSSRVRTTPRARQRPREHHRASRVATRAGPSDDPHPRQQPGNRANVVSCEADIRVLFLEQKTDRVSVQCGYCLEHRRGTKRQLLGDGNDIIGWWRSHDCVLAAVAA